jgi:hypothetical protein
MTKRLARESYKPGNRNNHCVKHYIPCSIIFTMIFNNLLLYKDEAHSIKILNNISTLSRTEVKLTERKD